MNSHMIVVRIGILGFLTVSMAQLEGDLRLTDALIPTRGKIEIFHSGSWGRVCDDGFYNASATVVCRQLFGPGVTGQAIQTYDRVYYDYLYHDIATIWLDNVFCVGNETRLMDCPHLPWGDHNCVNAEDVGVNCFEQKYVVKILIVEITVDDVITLQIFTTVAGPGVVFPTTNSTPPLQQLKFQAVVNNVNGYGFLAAMTAKSLVSCVQQCAQCCDVALCKLVQYEETSKACAFMKYNQSITSVTTCSADSMKCMIRL